MTVVGGGLLLVVLQAGVFEGKALDNQVSVSMNGHMVPLSCSVRTYRPHYPCHPFRTAS